MQGLGLVEGSSFIIEGVAVHCTSPPEPGCLLNISVGGKVVFNRLVSSFRHRSDDGLRYREVLEQEHISPRRSEYQTWIKIQPHTVFEAAIQVCSDRTGFEVHLYGPLCLAGSHAP